jgi:hypothetical protein
VHGRREGGPGMMEDGARGGLEQRFESVGPGAGHRSYRIDALSCTDG